MKVFIFFYFLFLILILLFQSRFPCNESSFRKNFNWRGWQAFGWTFCFFLSVLNKNEIHNSICTLKAKWVLSIIISFFLHIFSTIVNHLLWKSSSKNNYHSGGFLLVILFFWALVLPWLANLFHQNTINRWHPFFCPISSDSKLHTKICWSSFPSLFKRRCYFLSPRRKHNLLIK